MIGIFIGIAAVVSLISLGQGMQAAITEQFEMMGEDVIMVMPGAGLTSFGAGGSLTQKELELVKECRGVDLASGMISRAARVEFKGETKYTWVSGLPAGDAEDLLLEGTGIEITEGQERFRPQDKYKAVIGYLIGKGEFFEKKVGIGDKIEINDQEFKVNAKVSQIGNPEDDANIYIPYETAKELFGIKKDEYMVLMIRAKENYDVSEVAENIKEKIREHRGLKEGEEDFSVQTMEQLLQSVGMILDAVRAVLVGVAAISLLVGGVGIMNTMYTSVLERTPEIGVMKAVGAENKNILLLFLIESGILGMVGGIIGCGIGIGMSKAVEILAAQQMQSKILQAYISPELILGALAFSFIVGCLSGILPAKQASELNTVDALRYE